MGTPSSQKLKRLQSEKTELSEQLKSNRTTQNTLNQAANKLAARIKNIDKEIKELSTKEVVVSEHAMLRYIQHVYGIDLEDLKNEILADGRKSAIEFAKSGKFKLNSDRTLVVKDSVIVTIT